MGRKKIMQGGGVNIGVDYTEIMEANNHIAGQNSNKELGGKFNMDHGLIVLDQKRRRVDKSTSDGPGQDNSQKDVTLIELRHIIKKNGRWRVLQVSPA